VAGSVVDDLGPGAGTATEDLDATLRIGLVGG
jgi:hypothetical protein